MCKSWNYKFSTARTLKIQSALNVFWRISFVGSRVIWHISYRTMIKIVDSKPSEIHYLYAGGDGFKTEPHSLFNFWQPFCMFSSTVNQCWIICPKDALISIFCVHNCKFVLVQIAIIPFFFLFTYILCGNPKYT